MKKLIVDEKYDNKKLNTFLFSKFPDISTNLLYKTLRKKDIKVNGKRISENILLNKNDEVLVYISDDLLFPKISIDVVFEDKNILLVNKPFNIEVVGPNSLTTLIHDKYFNLDFLPMPCHRIDRNTSGLVLFAKNEESLTILFEKFKNHEIEKHYLAFVYGNPKSIFLENTAYLFKDNKKSLVYISPVPKKGYREISTKYNVLKKNPDNTCVLDVQIQTGRTHQIRAHLAYLSLPIIGDGKYGINKINKQFNKKYQMLYSYIIKFNFTTDSDILNYLNGKEFVLDIKI